MSQNVILSRPEVWQQHFKKAAVFHIFLIIVAENLKCILEMICLLHDYKNDLIFKTISRYINSNEKLFHIKIRKHDVLIAKLLFECWVIYCVFFNS